MHRWLILFAALTVGVAHPAVGQPATATVRGFVTDQQDGAPLQGANVVLTDSLDNTRGAVSNANGLYQIGQLAPGRYVLRITFVGYATYRDTLRLQSGQILVQNVALSQTDEQLEEVVVQSEEGAAVLEGGQQTVRPSDLARVPTPDVSGDLASYLQSLPSVVTSGDRGGQLYIRGGTPSQNLVLIEGLPVYRPFHIVGFYSAFPQDLVASADVYAGGFGASYSGRTSSVIDVSMREGSKQQFEGSASISPFLVGTQIEGPLQQGRMSILGSFRHSIIEEMAPLYDEPFPYRFSDAFVKLHDRPSETSRYSVAALHTSDRGRIGAAGEGRDDILRWSNFVLGTRLLSLPSTMPILFELTGGLSYGSNEAGNPVRPERTSRILRLSADFDITYTLRRTEINWGLFTRMHWMERTLAEQFSNIESASDVLLGIGGFLEAEMALTDELDLTPGAVLAWYQGQAPVPEPRLRLAWHPHEQHTFSAAGGVYWQPVVGITDERDAGSVFTVWLPADEVSEPLRAYHAIAGWQGNAGPIQATLEGYYRRMSNLPVPQFTPRASFSTALTRANGDIYGADARVAFTRDPLYAYVGYGWSWTRYTADTGNLAPGFEEPIEQYHPPHDRRHQLNALLSVSFGRFSTDLRWAYGSGLPYTQFQGFDEFIPPRGLPNVREQLGTSRLFYDQPYRGRLPVYHRLDASVKGTFGVGDQTLTVQIGGINTYNRSNLFYVDLFTAQRVDQLPLVPYLSLKLSTDE
jgi:hypothetical protein